jgi:excinuclease ABC subunit A
MQDCISIRGARLHNLKNIDLDIPKNRLVVLTGYSGSGKSTLAFGTLHMEGRRQLFESLGLVGEQVSKPQVDRITGLQATINIDQEVTNRSPRSTVGTSTEVYTYLRVLYARLGRQICPGCGAEVPPPLLRGAPEQDDEAYREDACPFCGRELPALSMAHFSFNKPEGACPECTGIGEVLDVRTELVLDPEKSIREGGVVTWDIYEIERYGTTLRNAGAYFGFGFDPEKPIKEYTQVQLDLLLSGVNHFRFTRHVPGIEPPQTAAKGRFEGVATNMLRRYAEHIEDPKYRKKMEKYIVRHACPSCGGTRLRDEARAVKLAGMNIVEVSRLSCEELLAWLGRLETGLSAEERPVAEPVLADMRDRLGWITEVGLGYLSLDRDSPTLSGGEAQRLRLANILGSGLTGLLYILDEPTTGLHPRDNRRLVTMLRNIRDLGNTVLVIEHDLDVIASADSVIDMGPGAGVEGGEILAVAPPSELPENPRSVTGPYLANPALSLRAPRTPNKGELTIRGARGFNLKNIDVRIPLGTLTAVTGVSGAGKSTLIFDILERDGRRRFYGSTEIPAPHDRIEGWERLKAIVSMDQRPIGRSTRSNTATYTDLFTEIRKLYGRLPEAARRGLSESSFSFNVPGGRCERCEGSGTLTVSMQFMPDVLVQCPACRGKRFHKPILEVTYRGRTIADVLELTVREAKELFSEIPVVRKRLDLLDSIGLGYLTLGQPTSSLSGGEAQRIKLSKELTKNGSGTTLYLLDEPTRGLHPHDISNLLAVLHGLVERGNTVVVIEHSLELVADADWVIDLGPGGGREGGELIAEAAPCDLIGIERSATGQELARRTVRTAAAVE